jgi:hypothetical protein
MSSCLKFIAAACAVFSITMSAFADPMPAAEKQKMGAAVLKAFNKGMEIAAQEKKKHPEMTEKDETDAFERGIAQQTDLEKEIAKFEKSFGDELVSQLPQGLKTDASREEIYKKIKARAETVAARINKSKVLTADDTFEFISLPMLMDLAEGRFITPSQLDADASVYRARVAYLSKLRQAHGLSAVDKLPDSDRGANNPEPKSDGDKGGGKDVPPPAPANPTPPQPAPKPAPSEADAG